MSCKTCVASDACASSGVNAKHLARSSLDSKSVCLVIGCLTVCLVGNLSFRSDRIRS